jgi:arsenite methyltransferase
MTDYLKYQFTDSPEFVNTFDEAPLWSASFGLLLLKHIELKPNLTVLDLGSGAGFPLIELAQRLGTSSKCYGLDPWINANNRARQKLRNYEVNNAEIIDGSASEIPFEDGKFDLIVSNLGINNFDNPAHVFGECYRVMKPGGKLALTTNLNGHWKLFYDIFEKTLLELDKEPLTGKLNTQQEHRGTVASISKLFTDAGFTINRHFEEKLEMRFLNGSAFLNHSFIKLGWLAGFKEIIQEVEQVEFFTALERNLNSYAEEKGGLTLTVPMAYIEGKK